MGSMSDEDLELLRRWIDSLPASPATSTPPPIEPEPEKPAVDETPTSSEPPEYYWEDMEKIFAAKCTMCHGASAVGGLDLRSYQSIMDSDVVVPEDPDESEIVIKMEMGGHSAALDSDELDMLRLWIWKGAL